MLNSGNVFDLVCLVVFVVVVVVCFVLFLLFAFPAKIMRKKNWPDHYRCASGLMAKSGYQFYHY